MNPSLIVSFLAVLYIAVPETVIAACDLQAIENCGKPMEPGIQNANGDMGKICPLIATFKQCIAPATEGCEQKLLDQMMAAYKQMDEMCSNSEGCNMADLQKCSESVPKDLEEAKKNLAELCPKAIEAKTCMTKFLSTCKNEQMRKQVEGPMMMLNNVLSENCPSAEGKAATASPGKNEGTTGSATNGDATMKKVVESSEKADDDKEDVESSEQVEDDKSAAGNTQASVYVITGLTVSLIFKFFL